MSSMKCLIHMCLLQMHKCSIVFKSFSKEDLPMLCCKCSIVSIPFNKDNLPMLSAKANKDTRKLDLWGRWHIYINKFNLYIYIFIFYSRNIYNVCIYVYIYINRDVYINIFIYNLYLYIYISKGQVSSAP